MEIGTGILVYMFGVLSCWAVITFKTGHDSSKLTEQFNQYKVSTTSAIMDLTKLVNSNIQTVGNANVAIEKIRKDLVCYTEKIDRTDKEIDNLQEHCARLRESIIDVREVVASKRPIHRHDPIQINLPHGLVLQKGTVKEIKNKMKEFSK